MTDRETLYSGLSNAAWGYFLLHVNFNVGPVNILPAFAGDLLLLSAIRKLSGERRDLALLRPLCILLAGWNALDWVFSWAGADLGGALAPLNLLAEVAALYFHFQFLTDMAELARTYQPEGDNLDQRLLRRRTAYVVLTTVMTVCLELPMGRNQDVKLCVGMVLVIAALIVTVFVMAGLFALRKLLRNGESERPEA